MFDRRDATTTLTPGVLTQLQPFEQMVEQPMNQEAQVDDFLQKSRKFPLQFPVHTPRLENMLQVIFRGRVEFLVKKKYILYGVFYKHCFLGKITWRNMVFSISYIQYLHLYHIFG